ncbi:hypothetical protein ACVWYN_001088 [Pedobacter sp. UYP24]
MKKRPAKRIQKPQQTTDEEKQLLDLMASLIVDFMLRKKDDSAFDNKDENGKTN